ncbi:MAG: short-chain dehydrogenase, partial [Chloroflexota bacterium]|nr:short-chain dehydrogenase [Chloroflexota bacterium]
SVESGALTSVYAATSPEMEGVSGKYLEESRIVRSSKLSYDEAQAGALWELSAKLTGLPSDSDISTFSID